MTIWFGILLRSNYRCGRMLDSRASDMAGRAAMHFLRPW